MATFSPLRYPGGKDNTYDYVRQLVRINDIKTYIEPFAGGAAVALRLLINNDVRKIVINDYDRSIYSLWHVIITRPNELIALIQDTPINMTEWYRQKEIQNNKETADELFLAFSTLFLNRTNRSGIIKAGVIGGKDQSSNYKLDCRFNKEKIIEKIRLIYSLRARIKICNYDAKEFIEREIKITRKSLTFFDPPYFLKGQQLYTNFYTHEDHRELARIIKKNMRNRLWILTYDVATEIEKLYHGFDKETYYLNYSISKPSKGKEFMFFSKNINCGDISAYLDLDLNTDSSEEELKEAL